MTPRIRKILIFLILPLVFGIGLTWIMLIQIYGNVDFAFLDAIISSVTLMLGSLIISTTLKYYRPEGGNTWKIGIWIIIIAALWLTVSVKVLYLCSESFGIQNEHIRNSVVLRFFIGLIILVCVSLVTWVRRQSESETKAKERFMEIAKLAKEAELNALRNQLQPHFLFNSLNSIQALIVNNSSKAREMLIQLSDFLRGTLSKNEQSMQTLAEEIKLAKLYLEIEKVRFGDRLSARWEIDERCVQRQIPALLLQPLIENSIKYSIYNSTEKVEIFTRVVFNADFTIIQIQNPFEDKNSSMPKGTGFGLSSVKRRLFLIFGQNNLFRTEINNQLFTATVQIPTL